jgi:hypothetical protein
MGSGVESGLLDGVRGGSSVRVGGADFLISDFSTRISVPDSFTAIWSRMITRTHAQVDSYAEAREKTVEEYDGMVSKQSQTH